MGVGVLVTMVFVPVAFVNIVDVPRLIGVVAVGIALVYVVLVIVGMMLMPVAFVNIVDVTRLVAVVFVSVALVDIVLQHRHSLRLLITRCVSPCIRRFCGYSYRLSQ